MKLGRYEILEELGSGGFGTVYKAEDEVLGRIVALKVLHPTLLIDQSFLARFRNEARLAAQLEHPNLIPVHDFSEIDGRYVITMAYMAGGSLKQLLAQEGKLSLERASQILEDVCQGLDYAHGKGIIHRDLKPGNILLDENGRARIGDLGFARVISDASSISMTASGTLVGTPAYMAPELWRNKPASVQTDIYSLGCILYEMLTGEVLFEGTSPAEVMTMHVIDGPQFRHELPAGWHELLTKCLAKDPKDRYGEVGSIFEDYSIVMSESKKASIPQQGQSDQANVTDNEEKHNINRDLKDSKTPPLVINPFNILKAKKQSQDQSEEMLLSDVVQEDANEADKTDAENEITSKEVLTITSMQQPHINSLVTTGEWNKKRLLAIFLGFVAVIITLFIIQKKSLPTERPRLGEEFTYLSKELIATDSLPVRTPTLTPKETTNTQQPTSIATVAPIDTAVFNTIINHSSKFGNHLIQAVNSSKIQFLGNFGEGYVYDISFSDNLSVAAIATSKGLFLLDGKTLEQLAIIDNTITYRLIDFSPDGHQFVTVDENKAVLLWDTDTRKVVKNLGHNTDSDVSLAWSPDGNLIATSSWDGIVKIWNASNGLEIFSRQTIRVPQLSWSHDSQFLVTGSISGVFIIWDVQKASVINSFQANNIGGFISVAWSPDGKSIATGDMNGLLKIWDPSTGDLILKSSSADTEKIMFIEWSPDSTLIATGSRDNSISIWNASDGIRLFKSRDHQYLINRIRWAPDGKTIAVLPIHSNLSFWGIR